MNIKNRVCSYCGKTKPSGHFKRTNSHRFGVSTYNRICKGCDIEKRRNKGFNKHPDFKLMGIVCELYVSNGLTEKEISDLLQIEIPTVRKYLLSYFGDGNPVMFHVPAD